MHHFRAGDDVAQHGAQHGLRLAVGVGGGGVDERAAGVDERPQQLGGILLIGFPGP